MATEKYTQRAENSPASGTTACNIPYEIILGTPDIKGSPIMIRFTS